MPSVIKCCLLFLDPSDGVELEVVSNSKSVNCSLTPSPSPCTQQSVPLVTLILIILVVMNMYTVYKHLSIININLLY